MKIRIAITAALVAAWTLGESVSGSLPIQRTPRQRLPRDGGQGRVYFATRSRERADLRIAYRMAHGERPVRSFTLAQDGKSVAVVYCDGTTNSIPVEARNVRQR